MSQTDPKIVDRIYEAAVVPELWVGLLDDICAIGDFRAGGLIHVDRDHAPAALMTEGYRATYQDFGRRGCAYDNMRLKRATIRNHAGFLRDVDLCTLEELEEDPLYREFLRPYGLGWTTGTFVTPGSAGVIVFDFARAIDQGPSPESVLPLLDGYRPHLARAAMMSARLGLDRAGTATETLAVLGLPAAVLGRNGRVLAANAAFERATEPPPGAPFGRDGKDDDVRRIVARLATESEKESEGAGVVRSFPLPATARHAARVVHILPIRRSARDVFIGATAIALVVEVEAPSLPNVDLVGNLFDLTPAEARVARGIAAGHTTEDCAAQFGVTVATIRAQLKAAMGKTGARRQIDLARLVLGAAPRVGSGV